MVFCMQVLQNPQLAPRQKDGILHVIGAVAHILLKKNMYKDQVEMLLVSYVFPEFQSPYGFLRARACWVLKSFSKIQFKSQENLVSACNSLKHCILNDTCLPVNVEACVALQELLNDDDVELNLAGNLIIYKSLKFCILRIMTIYNSSQREYWSTHTSNNS